MLLLLTAGLLASSLVRLLSADHGLRPDHVLTLRLPTGSWQGGSPELTPQERQRRGERYSELLQRVQVMPGVEAAALASSLPFSQTVVRTSLFATQQDASADKEQPMPIGQAVTNDYFRVMGIPFVSGRTFEARDAASKMPVALVNRAWMRTYFRGEDAVGRFLYSPHSEDRTLIIGVVRDSPHLDLSETVQPEVYLDFEQTSLTPFLTGMVVRTLSDPQKLSKALASRLSLTDAEQAVVQVRTLRSLIDENVWQPRFAAWLFTVFASLAVCLAGIGIYGVVAYVTTSRRRDFGIRIALGASAGGLFRLGTWQSLRPVLFGVGLGVLGSYWTSRWIESLLYKTSPLDVRTILVSAGILVVMALAATMGPAVRAARVDPAVTLRSE